VPKMAGQRPPSAGAPGIVARPPLPAVPIQQAGAGRPPSSASSGAVKEHFDSGLQSPEIPGLVDPND
jgi:hypothetical protein